MEQSVVFLNREGAPQPFFLPVQQQKCQQTVQDAPTLPSCQLLHCKEQSNKENCGVINVMRKLASGGVSMKNNAHILIPATPMVLSPEPCPMPDLGDAHLQINSCESAAGPVMSFPLVLHFYLLQCCLCLIGMS